jgi:hypothetical protein
MAQRIAPLMRVGGMRFATRPMARVRRSNAYRPKLVIPMSALGNFLRDHAADREAEHINLLQARASEPGGQ